MHQELSQQLRIKPADRPQKEDEAYLLSTLHLKLGSLQSESEHKAAQHMSLTILAVQAAEFDIIT